MIDLFGLFDLLLLKSSSNYVTCNMVFGLNRHFVPYPRLNKENEKLSLKIKKFRDFVEKRENFDLCGEIRDFSRDFRNFLQIFRTPQKSTYAHTAPTYPQQSNKR